MQVVQKLIKPENGTTFTHLADVFIDKILFMSPGCTSVVVAFDEYRKISLKAATRKKRTGKKLPIQYAVNESTIIEGITMKELLSHLHQARFITIFSGTTPRESEKANKLEICCCWKWENC